jgi:hypothetical protein
MATFYIFNHPAITTGTPAVYKVIFSAGITALPVYAQVKLFYFAVSTLQMKDR